MLFQRLDSFGAVLAQHIAEMLAILVTQAQEYLDPRTRDGGRELVVLLAEVFQLLAVLVRHHRPDAFAATEIDQFGKLPRRQLVELVDNEPPVSLTVFLHPATAETLGDGQRHNQVADVHVVGLRDIFPKIT